MDDKIIFKTLLESGKPGCFNNSQLGPSARLPTLGFSTLHIRNQKGKSASKAKLHLYQNNGLEIQE